MFTVGNLVLGAIAALVVGLSKTAFPGAALVATPIIATIVSGRLIPGTTLPILLAADVFAVTWFSRHARWDLLRPMVVSVSIGFAAGAAFFAIAGSSTRPIDIVIGLSVLTMVVIQVWRMGRRSVAVRPTPAAAAVYGSTGGFTTFVANAAGPILNTYLLRLGLGKDELVGTSAWFYFAVNLAKIPLYLLLGYLTTGGHFFTRESLLWNLCMVPAIIVGVYLGRYLLPRISQEVFVILVLVLSALGGSRLLL